MKLTNKRSLALAALSLVLLAASLAAYFLQGREIRFLLSAGLALVWGLVQLYEAFHTKGAAELAAALGTTISPRKAASAPFASSAACCLPPALPCSFPMACGSGRSCWALWRPCAPRLSFCSYCCCA